jgi:hypothetical protein
LIPSPLNSLVFPKFAIRNPKFEIVNPDPRSLIRCLEP